MSVRRSLGWMAFSQIVYFILQFGGSVVLARLLSPHETGVFAIALAVVGVLAVVQAIGLGNFLVREETLTPALVSSAFTINLILSGLIGVAVALLGLLGGNMFADAGVRNVLLVIAMTPVVAALGFIPATLLERDGDFRSLAFIKVAASLASTVTTIALALYGLSYMSLAYGQVVLASFTALGAFLFAGGRNVRPGLSLHGWREIGTFGGQMLLISGITTISFRLSEMLIARMISIIALGLYSRASGIFNMLWANVHIVIGRIIFVDFAKLSREGTNLHDRYKVVLEMLTALLWPAFAGLGVLAGPFIDVVYGSKWGGAAMPLSMLCIAAVLQVSVTMTWELFVVAGETGRQARLEIVRTVLGLALFAGGCGISLTAAAGARAVEALFSVFLYRPHVMRITRSSPSDFTPILARSAALTVLAIAPATTVMIHHGWPAHLPFVQLAGVVVLGGVFWVAGLALLRHPLIEEIARQARRLRTRMPGRRDAAELI